MADDPTAGKPAPCPFCGCAEAVCIEPEKHGAYYVWCGNDKCLAEGPARETEEAAIEAWNVATAERDHFRRRYVELYSTVWGEQYADFEDSDAKHAEAMEEIDRCNCALLDVKRLSFERDRLRVMAELLENGSYYHLRNGKYVYQPLLGGCWMDSETKNEYPTARAAIYAAMGWEADQN